MDWEPQSHDTGAGIDQDPADPFRRDRPTWLCYGALSAYAFWLYGFGPALALLQTELRFSYTLVGVYSALWAAGAAGAGAGFAGLARRTGRTSLLWGAALAVSAGTVTFVAADQVVLTMLGALVMGVAGTTIQLLTQSALSDHHGPGREQALVESNIGAGACAVTAPVLLGLLAATPAGWRTGMTLPALALGGLYLAYRREPLPPPAPLPRESAPGHLPLACWLLAALTAVGIAVEFCLVYFGAELLTRTGLAAGAAATAMSGFYLGILAGRIAGARLTRHQGRAATLVWASLAVTGCGFCIFWLSGQPIPAVAGLFICGTGVANLFPLSLALTLAAAPGRTDAANARAQILGGIVVIVAPLLLGALADHLGLMLAFGTEPLLAAACCLLLFTGMRMNSPLHPAHSLRPASSQPRHQRP